MLCPAPFIELCRCNYGTRTINCKYFVDKWPRQKFYKRVIIGQTCASSKEINDVFVDATSLTKDSSMCSRFLNVLDTASTFPMNPSSFSGIEEEEDSSKFDSTTLWWCIGALLTLALCCLTYLCFCAGGSRAKLSRLCRRFGAWYENAPKRDENAGLARFHDDTQSAERTPLPVPFSDDTRCANVNPCNPFLTNTNLQIREVVSPIQPVQPGPYPTLPSTCATSTVTPISLHASANSDGSLMFTTPRPGSNTRTVNSMVMPKQSTGFRFNPPPASFGGVGSKRRHVSPPTGVQLFNGSATDNTRLNASPVDSPPSMTSAMGQSSSLPTAADKLGPSFDKGFLKQVSDTLTKYKDTV